MEERTDPGTHADVVLSQCEHGVSDGVFTDVAESSPEQGVRSDHQARAAGQAHRLQTNRTRPPGYRRGERDFDCQGIYVLVTMLLETR